MRWFQFVYKNIRTLHNIRVIWETKLKKFKNWEGIFINFASKKTAPSSKASNLGLLGFQWGAILSKKKPLISRKSKIESRGVISAQIWSVWKISPIPQKLPILSKQKGSKMSSMHHCASGFHGVLRIAQGGQPQSSSDQNNFDVKVFKHDLLMIKSSFIDGLDSSVTTGELLSESTALPLPPSLQLTWILGKVKPSYV